MRVHSQSNRASPRKIVTVLPAGNNSDKTGPSEKMGPSGKAGPSDTLKSNSAKAADHRAYVNVFPLLYKKRP